jgi:hypothetical protein
MLEIFGGLAEEANWRILTIVSSDVDASHRELTNLALALLKDARFVQKL